jgi:hypothetical protein
MCKSGRRRQPTVSGEAQRARTWTAASLPSHGSRPAAGTHGPPPELAFPAGAAPVPGAPAGYISGSPPNSNTKRHLLGVAGAGSGRDGEWWWRSSGPPCLPSWEVMRERGIVGPN